MLEPDPSFRPARTRDYYLPPEDLGLIGDGSAVALVGLDGSISWLCLPRFDSEPLWCGLLDRAGAVGLARRPRSALGIPRRLGRARPPVAGGTS